MTRGSNTITHNGKVVEISSDVITVLIPRSSACSTCHAKGACSGIDSKETLMSVSNNGQHVSLNEEVSVSIQRSVGFQAVFLAFILPIVLLLVILFTLSSVANISAELSGVIGLASLIPYFLLLHLLSHKLSKKIIFYIEKL